MNQWPHAPVHLLNEQGTYMVTCGTHKKQHFLMSANRKSFFMDLLFGLALEYGWRLQAWSIMSNHYHFVAVSPEEPGNLQEFILHLHSLSATEFNREDDRIGRKVWYQYWDKRITFQKSYFPRIKYVNNSPVHHGVVKRAENYVWCSASWFQANVTAPLRRTVESFNTDRLNVYDNF